MRNLINTILYILLFVWSVHCVFSTASLEAQEIVINELMASNGSTIADEDGDFEDWIELLNVGDEPVSLFGYGLSDDYDNPFRWIFPDVTIDPGEFLLIWASGKDRINPSEPLHTNFSIDSDGEEILLTHPDGTLVDELPPMEIPRDISYGRKPDGGNNWYYFNEPTPASSNITDGYHDILPPPIFSHEGGFFYSSFDLTIESEYPGADIVYSLDGSEPGDTSLSYEGPVYIYDRGDIPNDISEIPTNRHFDWQPPGGQINKIMVVRARAVKDVYIPSETVTHSYIVDPEGAGRYSFPVVSLATHRDNFFDEEIGIYVPGVHYVPNHQHPWSQQGNFTQRGFEWERPVHFEYFNEEGFRDIAQHAGVRIHGGASRSFPQKSLRMYARSGYGTDWFEYPLFIDKQIPRVKRFIMRNSGNDSHYTMFRDVLLQQLVKNLDIDYQGYRPVIVFLNGEYWGIHNIRERIDKYYLESNHNIDPENIDLLTHNMQVTEGDNSHYQNLISFLEHNDIADPEIFAYVETQMEIDNFIDYNIAQIYIANTDWPGNNIDYWRPRTPDGRWRWILYDTDFGFGLFGGSQGYLHNTLEFAVDVDGEGWPNPPWSTFLLRTLLQNSEFQHRFIIRFADIINTSYNPDRVLQKIDYLQDVYGVEIEEHKHRWYRSHTFNRWLGDIQALREFAEKRPEPVRNHIIDFFDLIGTYTLTVETNDPHAGVVHVNTLSLESEHFIYNDSLDVHKWEGVYFQDVPLVLVAEPYAGYEFTGWDHENAAGDTLIILPEDSKHLSAMFIIAGEYHEDPMNPALFDLSKEPFRFNYWPDEKSEGSFPPHMVFLQTNMADPGLYDEMTDTYHVPEDEYHSDDEDKIGYPYKLTRRTRLTGWGSGGITFINTGRDRDLGAAVLALNTTGLDSITVSWTAGTILPNDRVYAIRLQYRVGIGAPFKDVLDGLGNPVEYIRQEMANHFQFMEPVLLPEEVNDRPYVQLRWKYYHVGGTSGLRAKMLLDNILVTAGHHPHTFYPEPYDFVNGTFTFTGWDPAQPEGTFPPNMIFLQSRIDDPGLDDELVEPYHIPFLNEEFNSYHADDQDKFGYPYMLTGRTRISGHEYAGVTFINTGRGRDLGAAVLALNTLDQKDVTVAWTAGTVIPNSRVYHIRLQYRVGITGPFQDVIENGSPIEYVRSHIAGHEEFIGPVTLPPEVNDKPYVQLRWKYYYTGERLDDEIGRRDMLMLSNITVTATPVQVGEVGVDPHIPGQYFLEQNYPNPFNPSTVIKYGLPERSNVIITIYSVLGREVATLLNEEQRAGRHEIVWTIPPEGIASGVYYYRIEATPLDRTHEKFIETKHMIILK